MERIWIRGTTGSGKTTLANRVSQHLDLPAVDLDDLNWMPGWTERPLDEFKLLVTEVAARPGWAIAGNYGKILPILEPRAELVIWLDYSFPVVFGRLLKRTFRRAVSGDLCCNGNRELWRQALLSRDSILWWCITTHRRRHKDCMAFIATTPPPGQTRLRHRTPRETERWLSEVRRSPVS